MSILEEDTGSHFDPHVIAVFTPMARAIYDRLAENSDIQARELLEERVRQTFEH